MAAGQRPGSPVPREVCVRLCHEFHLTEREVEVLYWVALGQTDDEIADTLSVSVTIVGSHLESAYDRLGLTRRVLVPIWAMRQGLAHQGARL